MIRRSAGASFLDRWALVLECQVCAGIMLLAGCGGGGPELVPVSGRVTVDGGACPGPGSVIFTGGPRPGQASFDTSGNFVASSFEGKEGLQPGTYKVAVECWETPPDIEHPGAEKSYIPEKYMNAATSGLEVTVAAGEKLTNLAFAIKTKE